MPRPSSLVSLSYSTVFSWLCVESSCFFACLVVFFVTWQKRYISEKSRVKGTDYPQNRLTLFQVKEVIIQGFYSIDPSILSNQELSQVRILVLYYFSSFQLLLFEMSGLWAFVWCCTSVTLVFKRLRLQDKQFKVRLAYVVSQPGLMTPHLKEEEENHK